MNLQTLCFMSALCGANNDRRAADLYLIDVIQVLEVVAHSLHNNHNDRKESDGSRYDA